MRQDVVAVGVGLGERARAHRAAGADAVLDHDGLAEFGRQAFEHQPRHDVGGAAGAKGNGGLDQARRPGLGLRGGGEKKAYGKDADAVAQTHVLAPICGWSAARSVPLYSLNLNLPGLIFTTR